jgi:hypothetical protein
VYKRLLLDGAVFTKFGRHGFPHARRVFLTPDASAIAWCAPGAKPTAKDFADGVPLDSLVDISEGPCTPIFMRNKGWYKSPERCFSVVGVTRSLDLEAPDAETLRTWLRALRCWRKFGRDLRYS